MFTIISAIGKNHEIGKNGKLLFHIKNDMRFFREKTTGHKVVMGRKTWESLPGKLENRKNLVVSRNPVKNADETISDLEKFIKENKDAEEEIFIIGGEKIYSEFLKHAKILYLTEIDASDPDADTFFPLFDKTEYEKEVIKKGKEDALVYSIVKYIKK